MLEQGVLTARQRRNDSAGVLRTERGMRLTGVSHLVLRLCAGYLGDGGGARGDDDGVRVAQACATRNGVRCVCVLVARMTPPQLRHYLTNLERSLALSLIHI